MRVPSGDHATKTPYDGQIQLSNGPAAMSLAWASGGRIDLHAESRTFLWDIAAGVALVEGAGGTVLMSNVDEQWRCDVVAGAPALVSLF